MTNFSKMMPRRLDRSNSTKGVLRLDDAQYQGDPRDPLVLSRSDDLKYSDHLWEQNLRTLYVDLHRDFKGNPGAGCRFSEQGQGHTIEARVRDLFINKAINHDNLNQDSAIDRLLEGYVLDYIQGLHHFPKIPAKTKTQEQAINTGAVYAMPDFLIDPDKSFIQFTGNDDEPSLIVDGTYVGTMSIRLLQVNEDTIEQQFFKLFNIIKNEDKSAIKKLFVRKDDGTYGIEIPLSYRYRIKYTNKEKTLEFIEPNSQLAAMLINNEPLQITPELIDANFEAENQRKMSDIDKNTLIQFMRKAAKATSKGGFSSCVGVKGKKQHLEDLITHVQNLDDLSVKDATDWLRVFSTLSLVRQRHGNGLRGETTTGKTAVHLLNRGEFHTVARLMFGSALRSYSYNDLRAFALNGYKASPASVTPDSKKYFSKEHKDQYLRLFQKSLDSNDPAEPAANSHVMLDSLKAIRTPKHARRRPGKLIN